MGGEVNGRAKEEKEGRDDVRKSGKSEELLGKGRKKGDERKETKHRCASGQPLTGWRLFVDSEVIDRELLMDLKY